MSIRANAVEILKIFQASCRIPGCPWGGPMRGSYQEANADRQAHLDEHRASEAGTREG